MSLATSPPRAATVVTESPLSLKFHFCDVPLSTFVSVCSALEKQRELSVPGNYYPALTPPSTDRLRVGVPREQKMLKGHLPRVIYHQVYSNVRRQTENEPPLRSRSSQRCSLCSATDVVRNYLAEMCSGSGEGSYLRRIDLCITQL